MSYNTLWLDAAKETVASSRRMIDAAVGQLSDEQFFVRPKPQFNSVAILLRHLGGNLQSRWLNFLTEDGEKPGRNRDEEFKDWDDTRESLLSYFDYGWKHLCDSLDSLSADDLSRTVTIRGEPHSVPQAIQRSIAHVSYHVGQLVLIARWVHDNEEDWQWLTIRPGGSNEHNATTWGTSASRGVAGQDRG